MLGNVALANVKNYIESAVENQSYIIFLNREEEIDCVSEQVNGDADDDDYSDMWWNLQEEARVRSGGPYFEILSFSPTCGLLHHNGQPLNAFNDDELLDAISQAEEERIRFYQEREAEFGPTAWPVSTGA